MTAKVADFGFSKYAPQEGDSGASLEVRGTAGYLDPEYDSFFLEQNFHPLPVNVTKLNNLTNIKIYTLQILHNPPLI